jgi:hypothetical protein
MDIISLTLLFTGGGGGGDNGRDQQAYTIYYSKVAAPTAFILLSSVNYNPANAASVQCATRATLVPANGVLAINVAAVKFDFTIPPGKTVMKATRRSVYTGHPHQFRRQLI